MLRPIKSPELKLAHRQILTKLVLRKSRLVLRKGRRSQGMKKSWFREWCKSKRVEFLPDGTPYKLSSETWIRIQGGILIEGLNKPLILVSDLLSNVERREVARHELTEWQRFRNQRGSREEGHQAAEKRNNPRLSKSVSEISSWFARMLGEYGPEKAAKLTRADYLNRQEEQESG